MQLHGHGVKWMTDSTKALDVAKDYQPDVACLDIGMPKVNGFELALGLRRVFGSRIKILAISGFLGDPDMRVQAASAGFDATLLKPAEPELITAAIEQLCGNGARKPRV